MQVDTLVGCQETVKRVNVKERSCCNTGIVDPSQYCFHDAIVFHCRGIKVGTEDIRAGVHNCLNAAWPHF